MSIKSNVQFIHDVEGNRPGSSHVWERNMGGHGFNDEVTGRFNNSISRQVAGMTVWRGSIG